MQQERDRRKDRLLNDVGIPIYRIPTTSVVKLDDIEKIFSLSKSIVSNLFIISSYISFLKLNTSDSFNFGFLISASLTKSVL